ncbi:MAG TPA: DedA family protein [Stellaceae bacterium]|jgi:membrane protein DedA with SNARE-associated domain|nr:DedA family protein [Stellaceae bacterium]
MFARYLAEYGYLAILVFAFLEGETAMLLAGYAAQQGLFDFRLVLLLGFIGAFAGDQLWFHLARRHGGRWLARRPHLAEKATKAKALLERHATLFILSFRFIYGLRNLGAVAVALSNVPTRRFVVLNAIAALVWAVLVIGAGYVFGEAAASMLGHLASLQKQLLAVAGLLAFAAIASIVLRRWLLNKLK